MPRNGAGVYTVPAIINPVVANTPIMDTWANPTMADLAQGVTDSLDRYGRGTMLAALQLVDGAAATPGLAFSSETSTGMYRIGVGSLGISTSGVLRASVDANSQVTAQNAGWFPRFASTKNAVGTWYTGGDGAGVTSNWQVSLNAVAPYMSISSAGATSIGDPATATDDVLRVNGSASPFLSVYRGAARQVYLQGSAGTAVNLVVEPNIPLQTYTNNTLRTTLSAAGQFGIGMVPGFPLDVLGTIHNSGQFDNGGQQGIATGLVIGGLGTNYGRLYEVSNDLWALGYSATRTGAITRVLNFNSSNRVLLNTVTSGIGGAAALTIATGTAATSLSVIASGGEEGIFAASAGAVLLGAYSNTALGIQTNNVTRLTISAAGAATFTGAVAAASFSGPLTGNVTGSSGSTTGNALTATALQNARAINGVNFDGTAPITVTADASTLTGITLNGPVLASSLTSVGATLNLVGGAANAIKIAGNKTQFESAETACPSGTYTDTSLAHGGPRVPDVIQVVLRCKTIEAGFAVGDEVNMQNDIGDATNQASQTYANATNIGIQIIRSGATPPAIRHKTTGVLTTLTAANWKLVFRAHWL